MCLIFAGLTDTQALVWHFKGRVAALQCERRSLQHHIMQLRKGHLHHVATCSLPTNLSGPAQPKRHLDHFGAPLASGGCTCKHEIESALKCMQVKATEPKYIRFLGNGCFLWTAFNQFSQDCSRSCLKILSFKMKPSPLRRVSWPSRTPLVAWPDLSRQAGGRTTTIGGQC